MLRVSASAALLAGWVAIADANPTRKVRVETRPAGATVFVESKENGPACEPTPCTIEVPVGETALIIELANYNSEFTTVTVPKRGKVQLDPTTLQPALGTLVVDGPAGAAILVNGEDKGKAPQRIEVPAETHKVVVTLAGKTLFDDFVDVPSGEEKEIAFASAKSGPADDPETPGESGGGGGGGDIGGGEITKSAGPPGPKRPPFASVAVAFDVGFRAFRYDNNTTPQTLRDETESGQVLLGPLVEIWPGVLAGVHLLRGLSLSGRFQFGVNSNPVSGGGIQNELSTFWQSFEVSVRHKWVFVEAFGVEVNAGWVRDQYRFNGTTNDIELVPDAAYDSIRVGGKLSYLARVGEILVEPYVEAENRAVRDGGKLMARFAAGTSASGLRVALGAQARRGILYARASAGLIRYGWTFDESIGGDKMADGGTDTIKQLGLYVGVTY